VPRKTVRRVESLQGVFAKESRTATDKDSAQSQMPRPHNLKVPLHFYGIFFDIPPGSLSLLLPEVFTVFFFCRFQSLLLGLITAGAFCLPLEAAVFPFRLKNGATVEVSIQTTPEVGGWRAAGENFYVGAGYNLIFEETASASRSELRVELTRSDQQVFTLYDILWNIRLNDSKIFAIWTYGQDAARHKNYRALASNSFGDLTAPNSGIPFAMGVSREGQNRLAAGLLSQTRVMNLRGWPQESGEYQLHFDTRTPIQTRYFSETLYTDTGGQGWFSTAQAYADWIDERLKYSPFPVSPACYHPLYDVWYWASDDTSIDLYWTTLNLAKELGFRSYLFDSGWESASGELGRWLEGSLGNYSAPEDKLPGFAGLFRAAKEHLGMNVILWLSPYAMGRESVHYDAMKEAHVNFNSEQQWYRGGDDSWPSTLEIDEQYRENVNLCPRVDATPKYLRSLFERVGSDYRPDGYWLDFQEMVPFLCEAAHKHIAPFGGGFNRSQSAIKEAIIGLGTNPTVEMRYPSANLNNKRFTNLWQSVDFPGDFDAMRLCSMMMRAFSRGVVMGTDEMYWPVETDDTTAAKYVATTVFSGVPAIGADFVNGPRSHADITRAWLSFYHQHQQALTRGTFQPIGDFVEPDQKIESDSEVFVYLRSGKTANIPVGSGLSAVYLANCTEHDSVYLTLDGMEAGNYQIDALDSRLEVIYSHTKLFQESVSLTEEVPQGGMLKVTRK